MSPTSLWQHLPEYCSLVKLMLGDPGTLAYPDLLRSLKPHKRLGCKLLVLLGYLAFSSSLLVFVFATCPELQGCFPNGAQTAIMTKLSF